MVNSNIVLDDDIFKCAKLYKKLEEVMYAYNALSTVEEIHKNSGNELLNTNKSSSDYTRMFAHSFNELIVDYVQSSEEPEVKTYLTREDL